MKKHWLKKKGRVKNSVGVAVVMILASLFLYSFLVTALYKSTREQSVYRVKGLLKASNRIVALQKKITILKYDNGILKFKNDVWKFKNPQRSFIIDTVYRKSTEQNIDPYLILAIIQKESNFRVKARSPVAYGLMQINYKVWKNHYEISNETELFKIEYNIELGIKILKYYIDYAGGNIKKGLFYYNNGLLYNNIKYVPGIGESFLQLTGAELK